MNESTDTNSTILKKPDHVVSLATSGILVNVEVSVWTGTKQDREISDEVTQAKKADRDAGRFVKKLLAGVAEHKAVLNDRQTWYNFVERETYPWSGRWRFLPTQRIVGFMKQVEERQANTQNLKDKFSQVYATAVANEAFVQGDMFKESDYPPVDEVMSCFKVRVFTAEVPVGDFRCQISNDLANDLARHYESQAKELVQDIYQKQVEQMVDVMKSLSHCCDTETVMEDGQLKVKRRKLYDTTLQRAQELCETFKEFNVTQDTRLEQARAELERVVSGLSIETLRNSDTTRVVVKESVDDIMKKFGF
jgi:hypothetical protein